MLNQKLRAADGADKKEEVKKQDAGDIMDMLMDIDFGNKDGQIKQQAPKSDPNDLINL